MMGFLVIWLIASVGAFLVVHDIGDTLLQRLFKAAIYAFIFVGISVVVGNALGLVGGDGLDLEFRR
jgi:hypothetical protein